MLVGIFFLALVVMMLLGIPVAFSLGIASAGYMLATGTSLAMIVQRMVNGANSFTMLAIPFFFMAGELMNISGVTDKIIELAKALVGHMKGGLAQVNIVASMFFAGVSGSATADTAALGSSLIPAMVKEGYDLDFSAAITVASSCVGPIIPPSITLVLYGILTGTDVGKLLRSQDGLSELPKGNSEGDGTCGKERLQRPDDADHHYRRHNVWCIHTN